MPSLALLQRQLWITSRKVAERHLRHASKLLSSQEPADIYSALGLLDSALKLSPQWEKALELKARALLCLRRFKDVVYLLHDFIPTLKAQQVVVENYIEKEKVKLLPSHLGEDKCRKRLLSQFFSMFKWKLKLGVGFSRRSEIEQWRYFVLGQACCHLGMMEDAMILLLNVKRATSAAYRKQSSGMREDRFCADGRLGAESDIVTHLLENIKFLLRRRTAALAALEAGLYTESARHFSKILEGRKGTPQGFIAECYMFRAIAYQAAGRVADAIADCNRTLALSPVCIEALRTRATLYEIVGCLSDCLQDLEQLKALYEIALRDPNSRNSYWMRPQIAHDADIQGCIDHVNSRLAATKDRLNGDSTVDYHTLLGVSRGCSRAEAERAYLLITLKHRPDRSAHFVDRCELVDERDIEAVKDEARLLALRLFRLVQRAYAAVMSVIEDEEFQKGREVREGDLKTGDSGSSGSTSLRREILNPEEQGQVDIPLLATVGEAQNLLVDGNVVFPASETWLNFALQHEGAKDIAIVQQVTSVGSNCNAIDCSSEFEPKADTGLDNPSDLNCFICGQEDVGQRVDTGVFPQVATCRELVNVCDIISQSISTEAWMGSNEWNLQNCSPPLLSVT